MNKSYRIKIDPLSETVNEIKIKLEQDVETLEFLSMSIDTKDIYKNFNADYGVLVGRVVANGGVGIPNAKISVFIPITEEDETNQDIKSIYPYKSPSDKNTEGKRYNLLPRVSQYNPDGTISPKQPFGSFPIKPEVVTNPKLMGVYKKYYKHTAITNSSGDYMIYGVPVGVQTVHLSVDITDIGEYSMTPAAMVGNLGYSPNLFTENNTRIKPSNDLDDLPHIETQEIGVDIIPFWGDSENFEIGITQQNFRIRAVLTNIFTIFGTAFTDGVNHMWANGNNNRLRGLYDARGENQIYMSSKRIGKITEKIYYYPTDMTDDEIATAHLTDPNGNKLLLLDPSQYTAHKRDGDFVFLINCNRRKVITNDLGVDVVVNNDNPNGVFTEFKGFITLEYTKDELPMDFTTTIGNRKLTPLRMRIKIPQKSPDGQSHAMYNGNVQFNTARWRHEHFTFSAGTIYSVAKFNAVTHNSYGELARPSFSSNNMLFTTSNGDNVNHPRNNPSNNVGLILTDIPDEVDDDNDNETQVLSNELPSNCTILGGNFDGKKAFGANWLNFAIYLPQYGYLNPRVTSKRFNNARTNTNFTFDWRRGSNGFPRNENPFERNTQPLAAGQINTAWFGRSDQHWTDFIETPKEVLTTMYVETNNLGLKGFTKNVFSPEIQTTIDNKFKNAKKGVPFSGGTAAGRRDGIVGGDIDTNTYIYRGWDTADCLEYLFSLNII